MTDASPCFFLEAGSGCFLQALAAGLKDAEASFEDGTLFERLAESFFKLLNPKLIGFLQRTGVGSPPLPLAVKPMVEGERLSKALGALTLAIAPEALQVLLEARTLTLNVQELPADARELAESLGAETVDIIPLRANSWIWAFLIVATTDGLKPKEREALGVLSEMLETVILRHQSSSQQAMFEAMGDAVVIHSAHLRFTWCNEAYTHLVGYTRNELQSQSLVVTVPPEQREATLRNADLAPPGLVHRLEAEILHKGGERIPVEVNSRKVQVGNQMVVITVLRDIRERLKAERMREEISLAALQQEKLATLGTLVAGIGHEINNPLTIASGILQRMRESPGVADSPENVAMIQEALSTLQRIVKIVRGLRGYAHSSLSPQGRGREVSLNGIVVETVDLFRSLIQKRNLTIETRVCEGPLMVRADEGQLGQVVLNLLTNARDALDQTPGARITLETGATETMGWLEVRDNGPGFAPAVVARVFDPFFTTKGPGKGTGLGLTLVQKMVVAYDGVVSVRNSESGGAVVRVELNRC